MAIEKLELDASPKAYEILGAVNTGYRTGNQFAITVRFYWKITAVGAKWQCYTEAVTLLWDRSKESVADFKAKAVAAFNALKAADTTDADLIFALLHLTI
mgnify:CR=1 FL=1